MNKSSKMIVLVVIVLAVLAAGIAILLTSTKKEDSSAQAPAAAPPTSSTEQETDPAPTPAEEEQEVSAVTITYTDDGFSPNEITIKSGGTITVVNESSSALDFSSDPHPTHTNNMELNAGDIATGESKTMTLTKTGSWGFHNHFAPSDRGVITVEE